MSLDRLIQARTGEETEDQELPRVIKRLEHHNIRGRGSRTLRKVTIKVFEVSELKCKPSTRIWFTLKAGSHYQHKRTEMGKIESRRITVGEESGFNSQHVMLVDTSVAQTLILSLKTSSLLRTTLPIGRASFLLTDEGGSAGLTTHATTALKDHNGFVTARVRVLLRVEPTPFPALLVTPNNSGLTTGVDHVTGEVTLTRPYRSPARDGQPGHPSHLATLSRAQSSALSVSVTRAGTIVATAARRAAHTWDITDCRPPSSRPAVPQRFVLASPPRPSDLGHPLAFSLQQTTASGHYLSRSALALVPYNVFDPPDVGLSAPWGVWTLVRGRGATVGAQGSGVDDSGRCHEVRARDFVALIHLAGPCVACRAESDVGLALAVATAMFCASVQRDEGSVCTLQLLNNVALRPTTMATSEQGVASWGRGFIPCATASGRRVGPSDHHDDDEVDGAPVNFGELQVEAARFASERFETRIRVNADSEGPRAAINLQVEPVLAFVRGEECQWPGPVSLMPPAEPVHLERPHRACTPGPSASDFEGPSHPMSSTVATSCQ